MGKEINNGSDYRPFKASFGGAKLLGILNIVLISVAIFYMLIALIIFSKFNLVVAGLLFAFGLYSRRRLKRAKKFMELIVHNKERSIERLASSIPTSYSAAKTEIEAMIMQRLIEGAYVDEVNGKIVIYDEELKKAEVFETDNKKSISKRVVVNCAGCGAKVVVEENEVLKCEFCDSLIASNIAEKN